MLDSKCMAFLGNDSRTLRKNAAISSERMRLARVSRRRPQSTQYAYTNKTTATLHATLFSKNAAADRTRTATHTRDQKTQNQTCKAAVALTSAFHFGVANLDRRSRCKQSAQFVHLALIEQMTVVGNSVEHFSDG